MRGRMEAVRVRRRLQASARREAREGCERGKGERASAGIHRSPQHGAAAAQPSSAGRRRGSSAQARAQGRGRTDGCTGQRSATPCGATLSSAAASNASTGSSAGAGGASGPPPAAAAPPPAAPAPAAAPPPPPPPRRGFGTGGAFTMQARFRDGWVHVLQWPPAGGTQGAFGER